MVLRRALGLAGLSAIAASLMSACHAPAQSARGASMLDRIRASGELRIGTTGDYRPYSFREGEADALEGIDIELGTMLASSLGLRPRFVMTSWPTLLDDLSSDRFDVAMSGISRTAAREERAAFSIGYARTGKTAIVRCDDLARFDSLEKIDRPGVLVLVNPGGTNERFARAHVHRASIRVIQDNRQVFALIADHEGDAMFTDSDEVRLQTRLHPTLCASMPNEEFEPADKAVLFPRDAALKAAVDDWVRHVVTDGSLKATFRKHIGP